MYIRTLAEYEKAWDAKHTSTLDTINNLKNLYSDQDKIKKTKEMYIWLLWTFTGKKKAWNAKHTLTLNTINNLKFLYKNQNKMNEAKEM